MLASYSRYSFKPHHFILVHDVFDNVEFDAEQYDDDDNFECNKENDAQFTWDFPINSSNLFHSSNISLESLNMKNTVKSKLGTKKVPLQEQIKKQHNPDMVETVCGLRIEDFAKVGTNCARLNPDSVASRKNSKKQQSTAKSLGHTDSSNQEQQLYRTDESIAGSKKNNPLICELSNDARDRVTCRLPDIPHAVTQKAAYQLSQDRNPEPASAAMRLPSLAEELKAALLAENPEYVGVDDLDSLQNLLPEGFHLSLLSLRSNEEDPEVLLLDLSELGSPEQIDPVNKYDRQLFHGFGGVRGRTTSCRKSCCFSESDSDAEQTTSKKPDAKIMSSAAVNVVKEDDDGATGGRSFTSTGSQGNTADQVGFGRHIDVVTANHSINISRNSADQGTEFELGLDGIASSCSRCVEKDDRVKRVEVEEEKSSSNNDVCQNSTCSTATAKNFHPTGGPGGGCTSADFDLEETDATHRGCHKFVPRHQGELAIEIGDYIYVQVEDDDLWCEGINLRTKQRGIFPTAYAMDLSLFNDDSRNSKFFCEISWIN